MRATLADVFRKEAEAFLHGKAAESGLGIATGTHKWRHGEASAVTLYGWCGELSVAIIFGQPDDLRPLGRGYLLWCAGPATDQVDPANPPPVLAERVVTDPDDLKRLVSRSLPWLRGHTLAEAQASFADDCLDGGGAPRGAA